MLIRSYVLLVHCDSKTPKMLLDQTVVPAKRKFLHCKDTSQALVIGRQLDKVVKLHSSDKCISGLDCNPSLRQSSLNVNAAHGSPCRL